jgi:hypothetical protein
LPRYLRLSFSTAPTRGLFVVIPGECLKSETAWRRGMDSNFRYRGWKVLNLFPYERSCAHPPVWSFFQRPHTLLQPVDAMLPLKQMILPLVVFDRKKVEPIFLDGVGPPRLGISGPREGRLAEPLPHRIYLCCPRVAVAAQRNLAQPRMRTSRVCGKGPRSTTTAFSRWSARAATRW